jgi:hypothetical protein
MKNMKNLLQTYENPMKNMKNLQLDFQLINALIKMRT